MANIKSAKKRAKQNQKLRLHNASIRSMYRTHIKKVLAAIESGNKETAVESFKQAVPVIDRMVNKNIISKNKAARNKSRLNKRLKAMA